MKEINLFGQITEGILPIMIVFFLIACGIVILKYFLQMLDSLMISSVNTNSSFWIKTEQICRLIALSSISWILFILIVFYGFNLKEVLFYI